MTTSINITASRINVIRQLLAFEGKRNERPVLYKKTAATFKKVYGVELKNAPMIYVKNGVMYKLLHFTYKSGGRTYESAHYDAIVSVGDKFKRLEK